VNDKSNLEAIMSVIKNEKIFLEVGKNCLQDFLCSDKISDILWVAQFTQSISDICSEGRELNGKSNPVYSLEVVLGCALNVIKEHGYVSRAKAEENMIASTAGETMYLMSGDRYHNIAPYYPTVEEREEAKLVIEFIKTINTDSDYNFNLQKIASSEFVTGQFVGYAVSMIPTYNRMMDKIKAKSFTTPSAHVGTVGQKKFTTTVSFASVYSFEGYYGMTHFYKFVDASGNILIWKTGNSESFSSEVKYALTANIKSHDNYKDIAQTNITHTKVKEI
jgi:hypothetical protein